MSAVICVPSASPLAVAVATFNEVFDATLALPMLAEDVENIAELAELRGRHDVAEGLRSALAGEATS